MVDVIPAGAVLLAEDLSPWSTGINNALQTIIAELRQVTLQAVTSGGTGVVVTFDTEDIDSGNGHSTVTNTGRYTAPVAGWYRFSGAVSFASNATGRRGCWWRKNGTSINGSEVVMAAGSNIVTVPARPKLIQLAATDFVDLIAFQDSGVSLNTAVTATQQPTMSVELVYRI